MTSKVFIGNLPFKTREPDLVAYFEAAGEVVNANIVMREGRSLGYGFVEYATPEDAARAIELFDKKDFEGRVINVELSSSTMPTKGFRGGISGNFNNNNINNNNNNNNNINNFNYGGGGGGLYRPYRMRMNYPGLNIPMNINMGSGGSNSNSSNSNNNNSNSSGIGMGVCVGMGMGMGMNMGYQAFPFHGSSTNPSLAATVASAAAASIPCGDDDNNNDDNSSSNSTNDGSGSKNITSSENGDEAATAAAAAAAANFNSGEGGAGSVNDGNSSDGSNSDGTDASGEDGRVHPSVLYAMRYSPYFRPYYPEGQAYNMPSYNLYDNENNNNNSSSSNSSNIDATQQQGTSTGSGDPAAQDVTAAATDTPLFLGKYSYLQQQQQNLPYGSYKGMYCNQQQQQYQGMRQGQPFPMRGMWNGNRRQQIQMQMQMQQQQQQQHQHQQQMQQQVKVPYEEREISEDTVFVTGLPLDYDDAKLADLFADEATVKKAYVVRYRTSNKSKGFGFVTFESAAEKDHVLTTMREIRVGDNILTVKTSYVPAKRIY